jgi:hypothetical protein
MAGLLRLIARRPTVDPDHSESAGARARREFHSLATSTVRFALWAVSLAILFAAGGLWISWGHGRTASVLITASAAVIGAAAAFGIPFCWLWVTAPVEQRDEARTALVAPPSEADLVLDEVRCDFSESPTPDSVALRPSLTLRNTTSEPIRWNVVYLNIHYGVSSMAAGSMGGPLSGAGYAATGSIEPGATELQPLDELTVRRETHSLRIDAIVQHGPIGVESELRERIYVEFEQLPRNDLPTVAFQTKLKPDRDAAWPR